MREELGPDFDDMDWKKLDPRQYDPRRIIREALQESPEATAEPVATPVVMESAYHKRKRLRQGTPAPFDPDAS
jgi:sec-independent protein translocase protein TatB